MFSRLSLLAVFVSFVSALVIETPTTFTSGGPATITWTTTAGDNPVFSIELSNPIIFNQALALANNVDNTLGSISITLPVVPATSGYTLVAVNITNINDVFATSGSFSIGETVSATPSSSASLVSGSGSVPATISPASTTPFGSTVSGSAKSTASGSAPASGASSASSASASSFNGNSGNGALSNLNFGMGSWAVMGLGAVFGVMATL